ncbi:sprT domain-containing protein [Runella sp.]|uniref:sprT domain-containing protein n=1 Tax=Runella sp. TaxID=1960881 RepID=UPI003D124727
MLVEAKVVMMEILEGHVPAASVRYCYQLWERYQFDFVASKPRRTRLGDFRAQPGYRERITVNVNLNPYNFLITYLHEVAHLEVYRTYKRRQPPHGKAWKSHFYGLLVPVMNDTVFPISVLTPLRHYAQNPTASTGTHLPLMQALKTIDAPQTDLVMVSQVSEGQLFRLNQKVFVRGTMRRTRIVCVEKVSQKKYLVAAHAWVEKV